MNTFSHWIMISTIYFELLRNVDIFRFVLRIGAIVMNVHLHTSRKPCY